MNLNDNERARDEVNRAIKSGNPDTIAKALMSNIWPLYSAHYELLISTVEALPSRVLQRYPVLRTAHRMTPVLARTSQPFKPLVEHEAARNMDPLEFDAITLVQMMAFRFSGDVAAALIFAQRLHERILNLRGELQEGTGGPLWYIHEQIGSTMLLAGDSSRALVEFGTARQLASLADQPDAERLVLGRIAIAHAVRGSLDYAESYLEKARAHPNVTAAHTMSAATTELAAAALVGVERMQDGMDEALAELGPYDSIQMTWPFALLARARWLVASKRAGEALEVIRLTNDAHPGQHGSVSSDIIASTSIEALSALGDMRTAWQLAEHHAKTGKLTTIATARLALQDSRLDVAALELRRLEADHTSTPGQRAEYVLLSAWLEVAQTGSLEHHRAEQISVLASQGNTRRLLATTPRQVIALVLEKLSSAEARQFEKSIQGLRHVDMRARPVLTPGELRVLNALPVHQTTAEIAAAFHVSPNTIKSQLKSLYRKLECSTREEAIQVAARHRLLTGESDAATGLVRF